MSLKTWAKFWITILVLLALDSILIFAPAFAPVPRQSAKSTTQNSSQVGGNSSSDKHPSPMPLARNGVVQTEAQTEHTEEKAGHNKEQQITVTALPEISVASDYRGVAKRLYDWGPWAFGGLVAVFSGFQIWLLKSTLNRVSRQADLANRQAKIMVYQVQEMRKVSEIENRTLILQYRPRVLVRNMRAKSFIAEIGKSGRCTLSFQLVNVGGSPAYITNGEFYLLSFDVPIGEEPFRTTGGNTGLIDKRTLQPGQRDDFEDFLDTQVVVDAEWESFHKGNRSKNAIFILGTIWYLDDLKIPRQTGIYRVYDPAKRLFEPRKDSEEEYSD